MFRLNRSFALLCMFFRSLLCLAQLRLAVHSISNHRGQLWVFQARHELFVRPWAAAAPTVGALFWGPMRVGWLIHRLLMIVESVERGHRAPRLVAGLGQRETATALRCGRHDRGDGGRRRSRGPVADRPYGGRIAKRLRGSFHSDFGAHCM